MSRMAAALHGSGRLLALTGLSNLVFWMLWPLAIVRVAQSGWSASAAGLFGSAAPAAMLVAIPLAHLLVRRAGPRATTGLALVLVVASAAGSGLAPSGWREWLWSLMLGLGTGLRWIAVDSWIADLVPARHSGRILSLGESIVGLGFAAGPVLAGAVNPGMLMVAAAALMALAMLALAGQAVPTPGADSRAHPSPAAAGWPLPPAAMLLVMAGAFLGGINETGFAGIAALLAEAGSGKPSLLAASAVGLGSFLAQYGLGIAADRWSGCRVLMACAAVLGLALAGIAAAPASLPLLSLLVGGAGGGLYTVAVVFGLQARINPAAPSVAIISAAAVAYGLGTLLTPAAVGLGLERIGAAPTLAVMAALAGALLVSFAWHQVCRPVPEPGGIRPTR